MDSQNSLSVGTAGWTIPQPHGELFPTDGTHLERYAKRLPAVEINSTFYKSHRPVTFQRWAISVPDRFRFSVKVPREVTHDRQLQDTDELLLQFLQEVRELGPKLGPCLVQLPPSFQFDESVANRFFKYFRKHFAGDIVCEPRHITWCDDAAHEVLSRFSIFRVIADPEVVPQRPLGQEQLVYYRLHGSPRIYYSNYSAEYLVNLAEQIHGHQQAGRQVWCIFDNTAMGAAAANAIELLALTQNS